MKEPFSFVEGRVVRSTQGRDKGKFFLVLGVQGQDSVLIADGRYHPLEKPKKKKKKHLRAEPVQVNLETIRPEGGKTQNSDLRKALESNGFPVEHSLCKEG